MPESPKHGAFPELQAFREALADVPDLSRLEAMVPELKEAGLLEQALLDLKRKHPKTGKEYPWESIRTRLEAEVAQERNRRMGQWQRDPQRSSLRLRMEILQPACLLHPPGQQALLVQALFEAGLPLAMGLERSPRPLVRWGHPLPQGVPGRSEWADVVLRTAPEESLRTLPESINAQASEGLRVLEAQPLSNHATPVLELCREARWAWSCPQDVLPMALERCSAFMAAESFQIEKMGKVGGQKQVKPLEIRPLVLRMAWEGERLHFVTRLSAGEALNPLKLMAGVLGLEAAQIKGLVRLGVDLIEDSRLATADKYETKLHNMFEDAVLLESGAHIRVLDEDDDEPLVWRS